jgi:serine/threonine protein kinase
MSTIVGLAPVREGEVLAGKFRVERVLGVGGMGVVVAATHLQLDQRVALKFVLPSGMQNAEAVERFAREARAAVRLRSEHVARVLDVGTMETGSPYIVMEFLEGRDLATVLSEGGPLHAPLALDYVMQACEAIAEAHSLGIVHRDLKPRNLFLTKRVDGRPLVKVLDFGISKVTSPTGTDQMSLTRTTEVMGSPNYMSPEQLRSARNVDRRTDIWSLGVILYELLTGRVPFEAETVTQLCAMVLQDQPRPLNDYRAELTMELTAVVFKCLEKDPAQRFQTVAELAHALEPFTGQASGAAARIQSVGARTVPNPLADSSQSRVAVTGGTSVSWDETELDRSSHKRSRVPFVAGLAFVTVVAAGGAVFALRRPAPPDITPVITSASTTTTATASASATASATAISTTTAIATAIAASATGSGSAKPIATAKPPRIPKPPSTKPSASASAPPPNPDEMPNTRH